MATGYEKIPVVEGLDYYRRTMILGGFRYGITLRYNKECDKWSYEIDIDGETVYGPFQMPENTIFANALPCLPWSFGGLYLERVNTNFTGIDALGKGSLCLWFVHSYRVFLDYGSSRV